MENLTYWLSSSKLLVNLNGATKPARTYFYLTNWLSEQSKDEVEFPQGVVHCLFDNEKVVGKRYSVKSYQNTVPMSVITSHACMVIDSDVSLQTSEDLKPKTWLFEQDDQKVINSLKG